MEQMIIFLQPNSVSEITNGEVSLFIYFFFLKLIPVLCYISVTIDSCTKSSLVITLTDAADGGITYIQGQGASCRQNTASGSNQHTFDFGSCGIAWVGIHRWVAATEHGHYPINAY